MDGMGGRVGGRCKREGIYVYIQLIHFIVQQKLTQHCKATLPQLKKKKRESDVVLHIKRNSQLQEQGHLRATP